MSYSKDNFAWLGTIPDHWQVSKLRQILSPFSEKNHPDMPLLSVVREKGVITLSINALRIGTVHIKRLSPFPVRTSIKVRNRR